MRLEDSHIEPVGRAPVDHFRVTGDDGHTRPTGCLGHVGDHLAELTDGESLLEDERSREPLRPSAHDGEVVDRAVNRKVPDRPAGEAKRLDDERVGGEGECLAARQGDQRGIGERGALEAAERVQEDGVDQRGRRFATGAVSHGDDVVAKTGPPAPEGLDPLEHRRLAPADGLARGSRARARPRVVSTWVLVGQRASSGSSRRPCGSGRSPPGARQSCTVSQRR